MDRFGINRMRFGLESVKELLKRLGDPQNDFKSVHIAGSDGKGSTCAMIYSVLLNAGVHAGMYTSPHLIRFNERISVNGIGIEDDELESLMQIIKPAVDGMSADGIDCTFFEVATALAFLHFSRSGVKYAVLETGLGGRLDATNVVIPDVTAITHIGLEHTEILGDTIEKIASEKAGIIKRSVPVVTANSGAALNVIKNAAERSNSVLTDVNEDLKIISFRNGHTTIDYLGNVYEIGIPGKCQAENAAIAAECVRQLNKDLEKFIAKGLKDVKWRGRMEYFSDEDIIIDSTHTAAGAKMLVSDIIETYGKVTLITGMFSDKDADILCRYFSKMASKIIITAPGSERAMPPERLAEIMRRYSDDVSIENDLRKAIESERGKSTILITGSLHMAGEAISYLKKV